MLEINVNSNITLKYIPMTKLKTTTVAMFIHRPLCKEEFCKNALLPKVLMAGCEKYSNFDLISKQLENLYGATLSSTTIKRGEDQILYFDAQTISDKYAIGGEKLLMELMELMLCIVFEPRVNDGAFDSAIFEQEKKNAKDKVLSLINDKRSYASLRCIEEMCENSSFALSASGSVEGLDEISTKALYSHYKEIIASSPIDIYICGEANTDELVNLIDEYTKNIEFKTPKLPQTQILKKNTPKKDVIEEMDVTQGKLAMGFLTNTTPLDSDYGALIVFNSIYGAGAHSKLFNNVREKLSLAYYASSQLERYKGLLIVNAGIEFENFKKAYDESLTQLEEIKKGNISELEFTSSIQSIINSYNSLYDDQRQIQNFYLGEHITGANRDIEKAKEQILNVRVEDVVKIANKLVLDTVYFLKGKN